MINFIKRFAATALLSALVFSCDTATTAEDPSAKEEDNIGIKVYLLGTFHFAQTDSSYNVLDELHQNSIEELAEIIAAQNPDKIFVERQPEYEFQNNLDSLYRVYTSMKQPLKARNELYQVGFRAAKKLEHPKVYQCDHPGQYGRFNQAAINYARRNDQTAILEAKGIGTVPRLDDEIDTDSLMHSLTLLEYIQWLNSPPVMNSSHASYIANYPQIGSTDYYNYEDDSTLIGAELTADWYQRNIMIYSKMINQVNFGDDKAIVLLIGADHVPIIKHLFDSNPHFKVMETAHWLKN